MPLSLLLLWAHASLAATDVWLDQPPPAPPGTVRVLSPDAATPDQGWTEADDRSIASLKSELDAVRPMADVFDGELQIMRRLQVALAGVTAIRPEDRDLVYTALAFEGFAVQRYFQDKLATDAAASQYRVTVGSAVAISPWVDAVALDPDRAPDASLIPDQKSLLAFQEFRAAELLVPTATIQALGLPTGGRLVVDGKEAVSDRALVPPGFHRVALTVDGKIRMRVGLSLAPGASQEVAVPASGDDLRALAPALRALAPSVAVAPSVQAALSLLDAPVQLVAHSKRGEIVYRLDGANLVLVSAPAAGGGPAIIARVAVGGGWIDDGEFFLENVSEGAPYQKETVNAGLPVLSVGVEWAPVSLARVGLGMDLGLPVGAWHDLPVGDSRLRLRPYPFIAAGLPWVEATAGLFLPWRLGVGGQVHVPVGKTLEISGGYVYGIGLDYQRGSDPEFEAYDDQMGWLGVGARFGFADR